MTTDPELLARQRALQAEADAAVADLGLDAALEAFGEPVRTGSSALGLMVRADVDITVVCAALDAVTIDRVIELSARLAWRKQVRQVTYRDDTGPWNSEPERYPDGVYLGLRYRSSPSAREWNFDIWFVDAPERQPDLVHLRELPPRLTEETRVAILRIKEASAAMGATIYEAVLDHGVRTPEEFAAWLVARG